MKIAIVGSRAFKRLDLVRDYVNSLPEDTVVISGGAAGVDIVAELAARKRKLSVQIFPADWKKFGKQAGFLRNHDIVTAADAVVAFWDGVSRGTAHTMHLAELAGKPVEVVNDGEERRLNAGT